MQRHYYAIIPANVRYDKELTPNAKLLYGEITALCNEKGYCWASNSYFSDLYNVSKVSISKWLKQLEEKNLVNVESEEDIVNILIAKHMKGLGFGSKVCIWCGVYTSVLHEHHYPIPKSKGGTEIVSICPNCHHEFHYHEKTIKLNLNESELERLIEAKGGADGKSI